MENATFRRWLIAQGCRFDTPHEKRGEGHGTVTIHREGRTAELPLVGSHHDLDPHSVCQVCEALGSQVVRSSRTEGSRLRRPSVTPELSTLKSRLPSSRILRRPAAVLTPINMRDLSA